LDPFAAWEPPPIPDSIFAPPDDEGPIPAWTLPAPNVAEPAPVEDFAPTPDDVRTPETPVEEQQEPEHEAAHSQWFDRAKMWAANNLYDPDADDSVNKPEGHHGQDEQNR
jgi:hypothetical protein